MSKSRHEDMASLMHEVTELKALDSKKSKRLDEMAVRHARMIAEETVENLDGWMRILK